MAHPGLRHSPGVRSQHWEQSNTMATIVVVAQGGIAQGAWAHDVGVQSRDALGVGKPGVCTGADGGAVLS